MKIKNRKSLKNPVRMFPIFGVMLLVMSPLVTGAPTEVVVVTPSPYYIATPHPFHRHPVERHEEDGSIEYYDNNKPSSSFPTLKSSYFSPSQLLLTLMRTFVEVLKIVNKKREEKNMKLSNRTISINETKKNITRVNERHDHKKVLTVTNATLPSNATKKNTGRGMDHEVLYDDIHHYHYPEPPPPPPSTVAPVEEVQQSRYTDPWEGYYEFIITEGSFKFWSSFQLATAGLLLYSALAAIYYAKFNPIQPDYDTQYDEYFFGRSLDGDGPMVPGDNASPAPSWLGSIKWMGAAAYQRFMDAIHMTEDMFT